MAELPDNHERQFSLVLALAATTAGLNKAEILQTVHGYAQRFRTGDGQATASLEKLFERDKAALKDIGVPIETVDDPSDPGNNQLTRYRVPKSAYRLPDDASFTAGELALIGLAAEVWREGSLSADSRRALTKLRGLGIAAADPVIGYLPVVSARDKALDPLRIAIQDRRIVEFDYLKPADAEPTRRRVSPLDLVNHAGRWLLVAAEPDGTRKNFLLSRIVGDVRLTADSAITADRGEAERALAGLQELAARQVAVVAVAPGSDAAIRLRNRPGAAERESGVVELHYTDLAILADELLALQPEATVLEPPELVARIVERLAAVEATHG